MGIRSKPDEEAGEGVNTLNSLQDAINAITRIRIQKRPSQSDSLTTQTQRLNNVRSPPHATIQKHFHPRKHLRTMFPQFQQSQHGRGGRIQLPSTMIRNVNSLTPMYHS